MPIVGHRERLVLYRKFPLPELGESSNLGAGLEICSAAMISPHPWETLVPLAALLSCEVPDDWDVLPTGNPPVPVYPSRRILSCLDRPGCASPVLGGAVRLRSRVGADSWRTRVASQMIPNSGPFPQNTGLLASRSVKPPLEFSAELTGSVSCSKAVALSVEFVAKPEKAASARILLADAIDRTFQEIDSYAGCMVLISEQEARLITVITFWMGGRDRGRCQEHARSVDALLASYVDRRLRVQTLVSHQPLGTRENPRARAAPKAASVAARVARPLDEERVSRVAEQRPARGKVWVAECI